MYRSVATSILLLGLFIVGGCNGDSDLKGGPGASPNSDPNAAAENKERTFSPSLSDETMELKPGQREELTLTIDRGDEFTQKVNVEFTIPEGLNVLPEAVEILPGDTETKVLLEADKAAETGRELALEVKFQPESGKSVSKVLKLTMRPRDDQEATKQPSIEQQSKPQPAAAAPPAPAAPEPAPAAQPKETKPAT